MDIIRCENCGHYQLNNGDLCHECNADFTTGAKYSILDNQKLALERWEQLQEKGFNKYMESIENAQKPKPQYMVCPKCGFKMLISEHICPSCNTPVLYIPPKKKIKIPKFLIFILCLIALCTAFIIFNAYCSAKSDQEDAVYSAAVQDYLNTQPGIVKWTAGTGGVFIGIDEELWNRLDDSEKQDYISEKCFNCTSYAYSSNTISSGYMDTFIMDPSLKYVYARVDSEGIITVYANRKLYGWDYLRKYSEQKKERESL